MRALEERIRGHRHFELFYYPHRDRCWCKSLQPTASAPARGSELPAEVRRRVGPSDRIFPSIRAHKFNEIEYAIPAAAGPACLRELRALMHDRFSEVRWPLEYRTLAADDLLLSPASGRDSVTISAHQGAELPYREPFREIEAVFRAYDGRPHWGKWHSLESEDLRGLYDGWEAFQEVRRSLDPEGVFRNAYLERVLGV